MKRAKVVVILVGLIVFSTLGIPNVLWGFRIELRERIKTPNDREFPANPWSFCVTEDDVFIIPDYKEGNIKIYEKTGSSLSLINIVGHKGYGSDELGEPAYCFYNKENSRLGVIDFGLEKIFLYDRIGRSELKRTLVVNLPRLGDDIQVYGDKLFISGDEYDRNGKPNSFYYIPISTKNGKTITTGSPTFLLPSYEKFGLNSWQEYQEKYVDEPYIRIVGIDAWFDIQGDFAYFVWEGDLRIIKININSGERTSFGMRPANYIKPYATEEMKKSLKNYDIAGIERERAKMSHIKNIFTSSKYVLVIYKGPGSISRLQFYDLGGQFINEVSIENQPEQSKMWFDKDKDILYFLPVSKEERKDYFVSKYHIKK